MPAEFPQSARHLEDSVVQQSGIVTSHRSDVFSLLPGNKAFNIKRPCIEQFALLVKATRQ